MLMLGLTHAWRMGAVAVISCDALMIQEAGTGVGRRSAHLDGGH